MKKKILIIEDEKAMLKGLIDNLKEEGFEVIGKSKGEEGLILALKEGFDIILLDLMLPDMNGLDVCKEIKKKKLTLPIIMLTAKSKESDKILGLELGADDYITKPFSIKEVIARINAVLRRVHDHAKVKRERLEYYEFSDVKIDFLRYETTKGKKKIKLGKKEYDILEYFIKRNGEVVTRNDLLDVLWGYDSFPTTRTVDNFIWRLRRKLEKKPAKPKHIISVRARGYKFVGD